MRISYIQKTIEVPVTVLYLDEQEMDQFKDDPEIFLLNVDSINPEQENWQIFDNECYVLSDGGFKIVRIEEK